MPQPQSTESFEYVVDILDRAMLADKGIAMTCQSEEAAQSLRFKCYTFRTRMRKKTHSIYKPTDPEYDKTPYDKLTFLVDQNKLIIRHPRSLEDLGLLIEEI